MRLLNDADFAESNHFFKATRLFIAQAAQQSAHAAELTKVRSVVPPRSLVLSPHERPRGAADACAAGATLINPWPQPYHPSPIRIPNPSPSPQPDPNQGAARDGRGGRGQAAQVAPSRTLTPAPALILAPTSALTPAPTPASER